MVYLQNLPLDPQDLRTSLLVGHTLALSAPNHFPGHRGLSLILPLLSPLQVVVCINCIIVCHSSKCFVSIISVNPRGRQYGCALLKRRSLNFRQEKHFVQSHRGFKLGSVWQRHYLFNSPAVSLSQNQAPSWWSLNQWSSDKINKLEKPHTSIWNMRSFNTCLFYKLKIPRDITPLPTPTS